MLKSGNIIQDNKCENKLITKLKTKKVSMLKFIFLDHTHLF